MVFPIMCDSVSQSASPGKAISSIHHQRPCSTRYLDLLVEDYSQKLRRSCHKKSLLFAKTRQTKTISIIKKKREGKNCRNEPWTVLQYWNTARRLLVWCLDNNPVKKWYDPALCEAMEATCAANERKNEERGVSWELFHSFIVDKRNLKGRVQ